jgi:hypothetical protein
MKYSKLVLFYKEINKNKCMKKIPDNTTEQNPPDTKNQPLTPHELVQQHMEHPDEPITDAEMENLDLETNDGSTEDEVKLTPAEKQRADELADAIQSDSTGMSYEADI